MTSPSEQPRRGRTAAPNHRREGDAGPVTRQGWRGPSTAALAATADVEFAAGDGGYAACTCGLFARFREADMVLRAHIVLCGFLSVLAAAAGSAQADPITFRFTATVTSSEPVAGAGPVGIGDPVAGRVTFERFTPDLAAHQHVGLYRPTGQIDIDFPAGALRVNAHAKDSFTAWVNDARPDNNFPWDSVSFSAASIDILLAANLEFSGIGLGGEDVFPLGEQIPLDRAVYALFPRRFLTLSQIHPNTVAIIAQVHATIDTFELAPSPNPVPEPTTLLLLGSGLAGIGVRRWRLRNQVSR